MRRTSPGCGAARLAAGLVVAACSSWTGDAALGQTPEEIVESGTVRGRSRVVPESSILVGQKVTLYVEVLTSSFFPQPVQFPDSLDATDAIVLPSTSGGSFVDRIDAESFAGISRRYEIFPVAPGTFRTPEVTVSAVIALDGAAPSPPIELVAPAVRVEVALPPGVAGGGLVVASPSVAVEEVWDPSVEEVRVGDAVERRVTTMVRDSVAMLLPAPDLGAPPGVAAYPREPAFDDRSDRGQRSGERRDAVTYVFEREGEFEWPAVEIAWWDVSADELRTETLPERRVRVVPNPDLGADPFAEVAGEETAGTGASAHDEGADWTRILALGLVALLLGVGSWRVLMLWRAREESPDARHEQKTREAFAEFERATRENDPRASYAALMSWLAIAGPDLGVDTVAELAAGRQGLGREVASLERRLYGSDSGQGEPWRGRQLLEEVRAAREDLGRRSGARPRPGELPPTLNPHG